MEQMRSGVVPECPLCPLEFSRCPRSYWFCWRIFSVRELYELSLWIGFLSGSDQFKWLHIVGTCWSNEWNNVRGLTYLLLGPVAGFSMLHPGLTRIYAWICTNRVFKLSFQHSYMFLVLRKSFTWFGIAIFEVWWFFLILGKWSVWISV